MSYEGLSQHIDFSRLPSPDGRFELEYLIGEGTYGEVYCAKDTTAKKKVAIKILETIADNLEEIEEEYLVLRDLNRHPNLPSFEGIYLKKGKSKDDDQLWFVMELCSGGSVTDLVHELRQKGARLSDNTIAYILHETVKALVYLHQHHCMHRDIKGHNILLTEEGNVKLVDFGVSSHLATTLARRNTSVGTPFWMSPEVIACEQQLDQSYDSRCDVWSLGITAIELAEGDPPLCELHPMRALFQIPRNPPPTLVHQENFSPLLSDFISECLIKDFEQRPFARELLEHPFMKSIDRAKAKKELCAEIERQRANGRGFTKKIEMTTKYGKLKTDRKSKPEKMYIDDLAALEFLSEDLIVEQLQRRYEVAQIYTYIGDILIACNPFEKLGLYTLFYQRKYEGRTRSENPPHIFATADASHQALMHQKQNQAIVISGESGAGKTESANLLLKQLVYLGKALNRNLEEKILQINPILESFGNSRTGINSNSSRFGKYLELIMTNSGKVTGARISVYLLEQSRVVKQGENEGNFHVFYYIYDGLEEEGRLEDYYLDLSYKNQHKYLRNVTSSAKSNQEKWKQLQTSFKVVGFKTDQIDQIHRILAAILNLGDIEFREVISNDNTDNKATVVDMAPLLRVSRLLGIDKNDLLEFLISNSVVTRGETIIKNNTVDEAVATRDAMAKALYGRLFDWMVNHINSLLLLNYPCLSQQLSIGLLDIFGFENCSKNNFEQLMINIANEQIQYYFNQKIFSWEQQEYMAEGIPIDLIEFADNRPILDMLLSRPLGLLALLDEESRFPKSSDKTLIEKFHGNVKSKFYQRPKSNALCFAIHHFAGRVVYDADGFIEKNKNFLPPEVIQLLRGSQYDMIRFLFQCPITKTGNLYSPLQENIASKSENFLKTDTKERCNSRQSQSRAQQTVATYFRYSLMDLLQKMVAGTPHFVRCIKPNDVKVPKCFEEQKVLKQLRYAGVLETIHIRQNGFSHRFAFADFLKKYCFLAFGFDERVIANRESCRLLLVRLKIDGWALGKSKVFLKYYHIEYLSKLYEEQVKKIILVQSYVRRWLAKARVNKIRKEKLESALTLQRHVRGWLTRKKIKMLENRKKIEEKSANEKNQIAMINAMQFVSRANILRRIEQKENIEAENKAAMVIQKYYKNYSLKKLKFSPEKEAKIKIILNTATSRAEAQRLFKKENFTDEDIIRILKKFYSVESSRESPPKKQIKASLPNTNDKNIQPAKISSPKHQNLELVKLAQNIHSINEEVHRNLRQNKIGIPLTHIEKLPNNYKRPPGFSLIPGLLGSFPKNEHHILNLIKANSKHRLLEPSISSELTDFDPETCPWDFPLYKVEKNLRLKRKEKNKEEIINQGSDVIRQINTSNWYNLMSNNGYLNDCSHQYFRPSEYLRNVSPFNYLQPSTQTFNFINIDDQTYTKKKFREFNELQLKNQQKFLNDRKENKDKKNKKTKMKKGVREDTIIQAPVIVNSHAKDQKKPRCIMQNGIFNNTGNGYTSFAEIEYRKNSINTNSGSTGSDEIKMIKSNNNLSKIPKSINNFIENSSSRSSINSTKSNLSIERSIIYNGMKEHSHAAATSSQGPFNFRMLLRSTEHAPTDSLRKRKLILVSSPHPDKNLKF